jgi:hypothetical protein
MFCFHLPDCPTRCLIRTRGTSASPQARAAGRTAIAAYAAAGYGSADRRVAVSTRLNAHKPAFDPVSTREFWRRASAIEAGNLAEVLHLKREENLADPGRAPEVVYPPRAEMTEVAPKNGGLVTLGPSSLVAEGGRIVVQLPGQRVILLRKGGKLRALDAFAHITAWTWSTAPSTRRNSIARRAPSPST